VSHVAARRYVKRRGVICRALVAQTITLNFAAQSASVTADDITREILETVPEDERLR
jgi:hypothetical protein